MNSTDLIGRARQRWNEIDNEGLDWTSFYNGWLEGRSDIVYRKTEPTELATMAATMAATLAGDYSTETGDYSTERNALKHKSNGDNR